EAPALAAPARLLPSGDAYYLLWGDHRDLLVDDPAHRDALWTSRIWPGAVMIEGEIVGTWRRSQHEVTIELWHALPAEAKAAVEAEAVSMPLPGLERDVVVDWEH
ncbi:MAG: crosslink repair DNA glycosylase YcaQ family protein, partial [Nitriliruptorales bacterium]|nr:crosslink repair DNA glycosylase YcaQ family protein [Nitriliruptorales bacterium]